MASELTIECAWCGATLDRTLDAAGDGRTSHGICLDCMGGLLKLPVTDMHALTADEVDALPFGLLELTRMGVVKRYNQWEANLSRMSRESVIGKDFFREVAPCTRNTEFESTFRELLRSGGGDADFEFVFRFSHGHRLVRIRLIVDPDRDQQVVMVQDLEKDGPPVPEVDEGTSASA